MMRRVLLFLLAALTLASPARADWFTGGGGAAVAATNNYTTQQQFDGVWWDKSHAGGTLNLTGMARVFHPDLTTPGCPSVGDDSFSPDPNPAHVLFAQTSNNTGGAGAAWANTSYPNNPISCDGTGLTATESYQAGSWTATISTTSMTVSAVASGAIIPGTVIATGAAANTRVLSQTSGTPFGAGVYVISISQTVASPTAMTGGQWQGPSLKTASYGGSGQTFGYGYFEMTVTHPVTLSLGVLPWDSVWAESRSTTGTTHSQWEMDRYEVLPAISGTGTIDTTIHRWPGNFGPPQTDITGHMGQSVTQALTVNDGLPHQWGFLFTHDWFINYYDRVEVYRWPVFGYDLRYPANFKYDIALYQAATSSTSATYGILVSDISVYSCPTANPTCLGY